MARINLRDLPPGMFDRLMGVEQFINQSDIGFQLLELLRLRVAQMNGCAYCVDMHHKELLHAGETPLRLYSLCVWREAPYYTEKEKAVLEFTERLTRTSEHPITDEEFQPLLAHFNKSQISILALAISQINVWTRMMKTLQLEPGKYVVKKRKDIVSQPS